MGAVAGYPALTGIEPTNTPMPNAAAEIYAKAAMTLLGNGQSISLEHEGHRYVVIRRNGCLLVSQEDPERHWAEDIDWDFGCTGSEDAYLGV